METLHLFSKIMKILSHIWLKEKEALGYAEPTPPGGKWLMQPHRSNRLRRTFLYTAHSFAPLASASTSQGNLFQEENRHLTNQHNCQTQDKNVMDALGQTDLDRTDQAVVQLNAL